MSGFVALLNTLLVGFFIRGMHKPSASFTSLVAQLPTIFGLGAVATFLFFLWASWLGGVSLAALQGLVLVLGVSCALRRRHASRPGTGGLKAGLLRQAALPALVALVLFTALHLTMILPLPLLDWDARILWALKGKILAADPTITGDAFRDPYRLHIHPRYPLLVPFLASWMARLQGEFLESHYQFLICFFAFLTIWQLHLLLVRLVRFRTALVLSAVMTTTGAWISAQHDSNVEVPLSFFLVLSLACLLPGAAEGQGPELPLAAFFLFGAAMVKNEGMLLAVCVCAGLFVARLANDGFRSALSSALTLAAVVTALAAGWFAHLARIPDVSDEHYLSRLTPAMLLVGLRRLPDIARALAARMTDLRQWHLLWLAAPFLILSQLLRRPAVDPGFLLAATVFLGYLAGLVAVYLVSPWRDIAMLIGVSFDRIALPFLPLFVLMVALCRRDGTPSEGDGLGRRLAGEPSRGVREP